MEKPTDAIERKDNYNEISVQKHNVFLFKRNRIFVSLGSSVPKIRESNLENIMYFWIARSLL